jgi:phospholipid-binding lipoprotein MlaA
MKIFSLLIALFAFLLTAIPGFCQAQTLALASLSRNELVSSPASLEDPCTGDERCFVEPGSATVIARSSFPASREEPASGPVTLAQAAVVPPPQAPEEASEEAPPIPDPFEPLNRAAFVFNDGFYFCVLKPVTQGYKAIVQEPFRVCFRNAFYNLESPIHIFNSMFQGKFKCAGNEFARLLINTTLGFFGFFDQAKDKFNIDKCDEDLGQTFGYWGFGPGFYIEWPFYGSSSVRDTAGFIGDLAFDPRTYVFHPAVYLVRPVEVVNETSFRIGDYEALKKAALDPYVAKREAYHQYRLNRIKQ